MGQIVSNRKGQFFVIALVLISVPFFLIFTFSQTTSSTEVSSAESTNDLEVINILNAVEEQKDAAPSEWYDTDWKYRIGITVEAMSPGDCTGFAVKEFTDAVDHFDPNKVEDTWCGDELIITTKASPTSPLTKTMGTPTVPCDQMTGYVGVLCNTAAESVSEYYLYYGRDGGGGSWSGGAPRTAVAIESSYEEGLLLDCSHINTSYSHVPVVCSVRDINAQQYNINYTSPSLKYVNVTPEPPQVVMGG